MKINKGNPLQLGVTKNLNGYNFAVRAFENEIKLELYKNKGNKPFETVVLDKNYKFGDIFCVQLSDIDLDDASYRYMCKDGFVKDLYAKTVSGFEKFGENSKNTLCLSRVCLDEFDWEEDEKLETPMEDTIIYKLHVRGFTKDKSSKVSTKARGTFAGIEEKAEYLKKLGVTAVELMPAYDFFEYERFEKSTSSTVKLPVNMQKKINYWGYQGGFYFTPKASYSMNSDKTDYTFEFKQLVKTLHKNGIEVIMEMYFMHEDSYLVKDCLRYWTMEYHVDGFHIYCDEDRLKEVVQDPVLADVKIFTLYWTGENEKGINRNICNYNTGFDEAAKRLLKGDENQLQRFVQLTVANLSKNYNINYVTNHNGFTMMDLVSYDRKHNEANNEDNRDGNPMTYSWNCGVEGASQKKKINELRLSQIKNAFTMLFMAQGTPLILAGDEFLNSQNGNNNPYCQDNETTWLNWKTNSMTEKVTEYVKQLISFRKQYRILHNSVPMVCSDRLSCGYPDVSFHGENAWYSRMESFERYIGIMYCSKYATDKPTDEVIYVAYNLHWEPHVLALPNIAGNNKWEIVMSSDEDKNVTIKERQIVVPSRHVVVLKGTIMSKEIKPRTKAKKSKK